MSDAVFELRDGLYVPSADARGPWDAGSLHGGAPAALLAREIERAGPGGEMFVARVTYEFLGPVPLAPLSVEATIVKPGKRLQIVEARLSSDERLVALARAVRLRRGAVELPEESLAHGAAPPGPEKGQTAPFPAQTGDRGFHRTAMEISWLEGSYAERGPGSGSASR